MLPPRLTALPLLLALAASATAQDGSGSPADPGVFPLGFDQVVYKGLVGNVLDAVPMDPSDRLGLQRTNALVSNTLLGRSLSVLAGLSNPVLLLGGFAWGLWSASNIRLAEAGIALAAAARLPDGAAGAQERKLAPLDRPPAVEERPANRAPVQIAVSSVPAGDADPAVLTRPRVFRVWLPQRSPALPGSP